MNSLLQDFLGGIYAYSILAALFGVLVGTSLPVGSRAARAFTWIVCLGLLTAPLLLLVDADRMRGFESLPALQWLALTMPACVLYLGLPALVGLLIGQRIERRCSAPIPDPLDDPPTRRDR